MTKTYKSVTFSKVLFDRALPFGHGAVSELVKGKLGVSEMLLEGDILLISVDTSPKEKTIYHVPWSRVSCAW